MRVPPLGGLPRARGPITERLLASLRGRPHPIRWKLAPGDADNQEDLHLALYCCYELHYQGLQGVDAEWEWEPSLLAVRRELENRFLAELELMVGAIEVEATTVISRLWDMATHGEGPSLSAWVAA